MAKQDALLLIAGPKKKASGYPDGLDTAAKEMLAAISAGDAKALAKALHNAVQMCEMGGMAEGEEED